MIKRNLRPIVLSTVCYLFFLLLYLPAAQVVSRIELPGNVNISGVSGTIWQGEIEQLEIEDISLKQLYWQIGMAGFLPAIHWAMTDPQGISGKGSVGWMNGVQLQTTDIKLPAALIIPKLELPLPVTANGMIKLHIEHARIIDLSCESLSGVLRWDNGRLSSPMGEIELGEAQARLNCADFKLIADISQKSDALSLTAQVKLDEDMYEMDATLTPGASLSPLLANGLSQIADADPQGKIRLQLSDSW